MPVFEVQGPDGQTYEVEAPDMNAAAGALGSAQPHTVASGAILPISRDSAGNVHLDTDAGILGSLKRAFTLPHDVMSGQVPVYGEDGHTSPELIQRSAEMAAVAAPVNPAVRAGDFAVPGPLRALRQPEVKPPTAEELLKAGAAGKDALRDLPVRFAPEAIDRMATGIQSELADKGLNSVNAPKTNSFLDQLRSAEPGSYATPGTLDVARQSFNNIDPGSRDYAAARHAISGLDRFIEEPPPQSVLAGPASAASDILKEANANYSAGKRSDNLNGIERNAELRAAAANSGANQDNSVRSRIASLLLNGNGKGVRGFNQAEQDALEEVVRGTRTRNALRFAGNLMGGGGGLGAQVPVVSGALTGLASGSPIPAAVGIGIPALGYGAKAMANALAGRAVKNVDKMTRMRSPLYEQRVASTAMTPVSPAKKAAILRLLLASEAGPQQ